MAIHLGNGFIVALRKSVKRESFIDDKGMER